MEEVGPSKRVMELDPLGVIYRSLGGRYTPFGPLLGVHLSWSGPKQPFWGTPNRSIWTLFRTLLGAVLGVRLSWSGPKHPF